MKKSFIIYVISHNNSNIFSCKKRKALSTVVTSAILMASISIMGVMLVAWSNTNLFNQQMEMESSFNSKMNKLNEGLSIENIWFSASSNTFNVTMNNYGYVGLNVTQIKLVNSTDTLIFTITDGGMAPSTDYSFNSTYFWNSGETVDFSITTNRGNVITTQEVT